MGAFLVAVAQPFETGRPHRADHALFTPPSGDIPMAVGSLFFKGPEETGNADIWVRTIDSGALRRLTETPGLRKPFSSLVPDGSEIVFCGMVKAYRSPSAAPNAGYPRDMAHWAPDGSHSSFGTVIARARLGSTSLLFLNGVA